MVYANKNEWAVQQNYDDFADYTAKNPDGWKEDKVTGDLADAALILNGYCNPGNPAVDVTSVNFTGWLKRKNIEMVNRMHDKDVNRKSAERGIYNPHDYLYQAERNYCTLTIALGLENVVFGGADST